MIDGTSDPFGIAAGLFGGFFGFDLPGGLDIEICGAWVWVDGETPISGKTRQRMARISRVPA